MRRYVTATQARKMFYDLLKIKRGDVVCITHHGIPSVVLMRFDDFEKWREAVGVKFDSPVKRASK